MIGDHERRYLRRYLRRFAWGSVVAPRQPDRPCCMRCGSPDGDSLLALQPGPDSRHRHTDPDECSTGDAAYDAATRLYLRWPPKGRSIMPSAPRAARLLDVVCEKGHRLGCVYPSAAGLLLLAITDTSGRNKPTVRAGTRRLETIRVHYAEPTLLDWQADELVSAVSCACGSFPLSGKMRTDLADEAVRATSRAGTPRRVLQSSRMAGPVR